MKNADMTAMSITNGQLAEALELGAVGSGGLTKREIFTMSAMQGIIAADRTNGSEKLCGQDVAAMAVDYADETLAYLEEANEQP